MVYTITLLSRHGRRQLNLWWLAFSKFTLANNYIWILLMVIVYILFCYFHFPFSPLIATTPCSPGMEQAISSHRQNCLTVSIKASASDKAVLHLLFSLLMRPTDSASALTTTFLDGFFGYTLSTFLSDFPMDCSHNLGVAGPTWVFGV